MFAIIIIFRKSMCGNQLVLGQKLKGRILGLLETDGNSDPESFRPHWVGMLWGQKQNRAD